MNIKKFFIMIAVILIIVTILIVVNAIRSNVDVKHNNDYKMSKKIIENNFSNTKNTFSIIGYDVANNITTIEEININNNVSNVLNGYIPPQNNIIDASTTHIEKVIENPVREKVELKIIEKTLNKNGMVLNIIDKNEFGFDWEIEYKIQQENNGNWEDLHYKINPLWNDMSLVADENGQYIQKIDWSKMYGELNTGKYRLVKKVYDNLEQKYIEFYIDFIIR